MSETILFVDDEPNVLQAIQRQLRKRFTMEIAGSGEEALRVLKERGPIAVIVADMRMPGMNGVELLSQVKLLYPDTVRLMLTGNADQETAIEAVNNGQIFRFLTKPCPQSVFVTSLALALHQHHLLTAEKELLQKTLKGCVNILSELLGVANPLAYSAASRIKPYVITLAEALQLPRLWQYELAALLCQIGCFSLPAEVLTKVYAGTPLTEEEQTMYQDHPKVGAALLEQLPRLEAITQMVALHMLPFSAYDASLNESHDAEVVLGAQMLKVAVDYDRKRHKGLGHEQALEAMRRHRASYNPKILEKLTEVRLEVVGQPLALKVEQISEGMITLEDVRTKAGVLIIPKGQLITRPILQGLKNFATKGGLIEPLQVQFGATEEVSPAS